MNIKTSTRLALGVLMAGAVSAGVLGATVASATTIATTHAKINHDGLAFGKDIDATTGVPGKKGDFTWDLASGVTKVNVVGKFAVIGRSGVPVRLDLTYYTGLNGTGTAFSSAHTTGFTPASDALVVKNLNWTPKGGVGVQSAQLCVSSDADRDGVYTLEKCAVSSL